MPASLSQAPTCADGRGADKGYSGRRGLGHISSLLKAIAMQIQSVSVMLILYQMISRYDKARASKPNH